MSSDFVAAIDLGSNSFHMIVARIVDGRVQILDRLREMVQLAAGLDSRNHLSGEAQQRALACLARFGQRLRQIPPERLRIVGTNTLRQARNSADFVSRAETLLGHKVEVVSGQEEARLIYLGVAHSVADVVGRRLVIDIGGGSTELIVGAGFEPQHLTSLRMGCVSLSRAFPEGRVTRSQLRDAELRVQLNVEPVREDYLGRGWAVATGASGSIKAIQDVLISEGWSRECITLDGLRRLRSVLLELRDIAAIAERWQLEPARARVFAGGFVVLHGLCEALNIEEMGVSEGALREGLVYDLLGRIRHEDVRDRTITEVTRRFGLDEAQAARVSRTALDLLRQVSSRWPLKGEEMRELLERAARLHEIGLLLTHDRYHRHGAYVLEHSDLPGYSRDDQQLLAALVRRHRRSFPSDAFAGLPKEWARPAARLCALLRLAVVLHRGRSSDPLPALGLHVAGRRIRLGFPRGWLDGHPLTRADLLCEARLLRKAGFVLELDDRQRQPTDQPAMDQDSHA
ncbi:MAG: HD domain-containing protein [Candidatus Accumulibacter sp.]|nr:HD domain-containing protein [Accumulibacter sp.]MCM8594685.1 HD domain-containing protein [Accumulibacter sp.]MCM8625899.1 HD domain-containing protein [Accumulibacter sp.]